MGARDGDEEKAKEENPDPPVTRAFRLRVKLSKAIEDSKWKRANRLSIKLSKVLVECADPSNCETGRPHAEGIFSIGWQRYLKAPDYLKSSMSWCNECIEYFRHLNYSGKK